MKVQNYKFLEVYWSKQCHAKPLCSIAVHTVGTLIMPSPPPVIFCPVWHITHKDACRVPSTHLSLTLDWLVGLFVGVGSYVSYHYHYMIYRLEAKV